MLAEDEAVTWPPEPLEKPSGPNTTHVVRSQTTEYSSEFVATYFGPSGITFYRLSTDYNAQMAFFLSHVEVAEMIAAYQKALAEVESTSNGAR